MRLELLLERIRQDEHLKRSLEETDNLPDDALLDSLIKEFEQVLERYRGLNAFAGKAKDLAARTELTNQVPAVTQPVPPSPRKGYRERKKGILSSPPVEQLRIEPIKIGLPLIDLHEAEREMMMKRAEGERKARVQNELAMIERMIQSEIERDWKDKSKGIQSEVARLEHAKYLLRQELATIEEHEEAAPAPVETTESSQEPQIAESDLLYLHAVSSPQEQRYSDGPNALHDVKVIDGAGSIVYRDHAGVRCYLSTMRADTVSVTKSGMLLLNKKESLQMRAAHEEILNRLREGQAIVAFRFGMVLRNLEELAERIEVAAVDLHIALDAEERSKLWTVKVYALDEIISAQLATPQASIQTAEHTRDPKRHQKRSDIKSLERVLQHEQRVAEAIHQAFSSSSSAASLHSLIGLGNGTSREWKIILDSTYRVPPSGRAKFAAMVRKFQEDHKNAGLMFEVSAGADRFAFASETESVQSISA